MKAGRQAEEQSTAETPVSSVSSDRGLEAEAGRVNTVLQDGLKTIYNCVVLVLSCSLCWSLSLNSVATRERAWDTDPQ